MKLTCLFMLFFSASFSACSRDTYNSLDTQKHDHELSVHEENRSVIYSLNDCQFRINNLESGKFDVSKNDPTLNHELIGTYFSNSHSTEKYDVEWGFSVQCVNANFEDGMKFFLPAKKENNKWVFSSGDAGIFGCEHPLPGSLPTLCDMQNEQVFSPDQNFTPVLFSGENWNGTGFLIDEINGEKDYRTREMRFCLISKSEVALCGVSYLRKLRPPYNDVYKNVVSILHSVEFVSEPNTAPP